LFCLAIAVYLFLSAILLEVYSERVPLFGRLTGRCGKCGYELHGLSQGAVCPECGSAEREREGRRSWVRTDPKVMSSWYLTLAGFGAALLLAWPLAWLFDIAGYLTDGFSMSKALSIPPRRELASAGTIFVLMSPFLGMVSISPLALVIRNPKMARRAILVCWLLGLAGGFGVSIWCPEAQGGPQ